MVDKSETYIQEPVRESFGPLGGGLLIGGEDCDQGPSGFDDSAFARSAVTLARIVVLEGRVVS